MRYLAVSVVVALLLMGPRLSAQKQGQLFINLIAPDGTPVTDLQAGDVSVAEDGVDCKVVKLEAINWPTRLQVLVDNGRANTNPITSLRDGLKALFEQMPEGMEMSLYTTAGAPRPIVRPTTDRQKLIDGIALIAPDSGAGAFFDALFEATSRIDRDKTPSFPVILMIGSDIGRLSPLDRDYRRLQDNLIKHGVTAHITVMQSSSGTTTSGGAAQTEIGIAVTKMTGGQYESINSPTRLATLLPEIGKRIAASHARQSHQYRITYERPANPTEQPRISAGVKREGRAELSLNGRLP